MKYFSKKSFTMRQVVGLLTFVFLGIAAIGYAVTLPYPDFISGQPISSDQVDLNFTALKNAVDPLEVSNYFQFGNLNQAAVTVTTSWTKLITTATTHSFTKSRGDTKIEVHVNSRFVGGTFVGAIGLLFDVRIDDAISPNFGNNASIITTGTSEFQSIYAVFQGLAAGPHTVSLWARTNAGTSTGVYMDPGGWGGKIIVKESW